MCVFGLHFCIHICEFASACYGRSQANRYHVSSRLKWNKEQTRSRSVVSFVSNRCVKGMAVSAAILCLAFYVSDVVKKVGMCARSNASYVNPSLLSIIKERTDGPRPRGVVNRRKGEKSTSVSQILME